MTTETVKNELEGWKNLLLRGTATALWAGVSAGVMVIFSHHARLADMERWISEHSESKTEWVRNHERSDDARSLAFTEAINHNASEIQVLREAFADHRQSNERRLSRCEAMTDR